MNKVFCYARVFTAAAARRRPKHQHPDRSLTELRLRPDLSGEDIRPISPAPALNEMLSLLREGDTVAVHPMFLLNTIPKQL
ncbi:hypothetical protein [Telluribacter humicola]|uniref:hypothetical protein n=1 Tax=Telluribacter humicola TaxID=1720261 RepID=UPI001A95D653|nr:hypothetical protein [Telluribacter humicola]